MYEMRKINKKLVIVDASGQIIYSMPFWVRVPNRRCLQELADRFNELGSNDIGAIMEFETRHSTVKKKDPRLK